MRKVFVTSNSFAKHKKDVVEYLNTNGFEVVFGSKKNMTSDEIAAEIGEAEAIICGIDPIDKNVLDAGKNLKIVCMHGTGVDHIDLKYAASKGIYVSNAPGGNNNAVAEMTVALMLNEARKIISASNSIKDYKWKREMGFEISNKTIGIIGLGAIGKRVVKLLSGFGVKIMAYDPYRASDFENSGEVRYASLDEIYKEADFISLHAPLTNETHHLINEKALSKMKPSAIIINTSRGGLIDEEALYRAVKEKKIAGAAIDAFKSEPLEDESKLRELDITLTPHLAATSFESVHNVDWVNVRSIVDVLKNKDYESVINM